MGLKMGGMRGRSPDPRGGKVGTQLLWPGGEGTVEVKFSHPSQPHTQHQVGASDVS